MSKMLKRIPAELMVASSLLLAPSLTLTSYGQNNQPSSTPPTSTQPSNTPPSSTPPSSTPSSTPPSAPDAAVPSADGKMPGVKPGSVDDVSAVGTRDIGGRGMGNWYSTETEIQIGRAHV